MITDSPRTGICLIPVQTIDGVSGYVLSNNQDDRDIEFKKETFGERYC